MSYLKKFQKNNGLVPDGIIGKNTLLKMKEVFGISSDETMAHFIGQLVHESGDFKYGRENLNYSANSLRLVFKKYFPTKELQEKYARQPEKIANIVYANRMGNGDTASGEGWKYRGAYSLQITGKQNFTYFSKYVNDKEVLNNPGNTVDKYYWEAALFFFEINNLYPLTKVVDYNSVRKLTRRINGGYNGLQHRYDMTIKYYNILKKK